jgi:tricorn protease
VRFPSTDGRRIVYHAGADSYIFDPGADTARKLDIRIRSPRPQHSRRFVSAEEYWESFDLHPKGHTLTSVHRGGLFTMPLWEGAPVRLGATSSVRYRLGTWLGDGARILAATDEGGEEALLVTGPGQPGEARRISGDFGRPLEIWPAPPVDDGDETGKDAAEARSRKKKAKKTRRRGRPAADRIALTNHRHDLILVDLKTGKSTLVDRSPHHRIAGAAWSPDGRWLAYGFSAGERTSGIRLLEIDSGTVTPVTGEDFFDGYPSFDPDGKYLYFLSWRTFDPVYDSMYFDLGFPKGSKPYLVTLREKTVSPFETAGLTPRAPGAEKDDEETADDPDEFGIDLDGISRRVVAFPVAEGQYGRIAGARGRALYSSYPVSGALSDPHESAGGVLDYWDFERNKSGRVADKVSGFRLSLDRKVLGVVSADRLRVLPASYRDDPDRPEKDECSRESGWVNLDRIPVAVVPADEWKQMYSEAWRLQREHFWRPDMSGTDWESVHERYLPLLSRVATRSEFSDLMWEVQGELGTSHCYEMGGDYRPRPNWRQGFLGADLTCNQRSRRWRIDRIPDGDAWDKSSASPLAAPGVGLKPGDEILYVGNDRLGPTVSPYERLTNLAGREVRLTVRRRRGRGWSPDETVTVRTLGDESALRYRDWVEGNRRRVHEASNGRIGYVHVPDMGPAGYAEFHRYYSAESVRDGLIVDVRFNRGGHVSQLLLEKLVRQRIAYDVSRWSEPIPYPDAAPMGPMAAHTNEYAGADGDLFCHAFKLYGLGPLIGKRTWGGVIGIWPRHSLVDGTVTTQPEYAAWFVDVGYDVENYGTDPDIEVENLPEDHVAGRDRQLERALQAVGALLRTSRPKKPDLRKLRARS